MTGRAWLHLTAHFRCVSLLEPSSVCWVKSNEMKSAIFFPVGNTNFETLHRNVFGWCFIQLLKNKEKKKKNQKKNMSKLQKHFQVLGTWFFSLHNQLFTSKSEFVYTSTIRTPENKDQTQFLDRIGLEYVRRC